MVIYMLVLRRSKREVIDSITADLKDMSSANDIKMNI